MRNLTLKSKVFTLVAAFAVIAGLLSPAGQSFAAHLSAAMASPNPAVMPGNGNACQGFPETSQFVCGRFLTYWQQNGGLAQQGMPIGAPYVMVSNDDQKQYTVQKFERAWFELHPENNPPYDVLLTRLGALYNGDEKPVVTCTICPGGFDPWHDDVAPTAPDPINRDGVDKDVWLNGCSGIDIEATSNGNGGPAADNGNGTHDFSAMKLNCGFGTVVQPYSVSHARVWQFQGNPDYQAMRCHVLAEGVRYWWEHKDNSQIKVTFEGQPIENFIKVESFKMPNN